MPQVTQDDLDFGAVQSFADVSAASLHADREIVEESDTALVTLNTLASLGIGENRQKSCWEKSQGKSGEDACSLPLREGQSSFGHPACPSVRLFAFARRVKDSERITERTVAHRNKHPIFLEGDFNKFVHFADRSCRY